MGKRIKQYVIKGICILLLVLMTGNLAACSGTDGDSARSAVRQKNNSKEEKEQGEIPDDLMPGGDAPVSENSPQDEEQEQDGAYDEGEASGGSSSGSSSLDGASEQAPLDNGNLSSGGAQKSTIEVTFVIESSEAKPYGYEVSCSETISLKKGATVYDALAASGLDYSGGSYITSIGGLAEKACGSSSGWKYYVNGKEPGASCNKYTLQDGDSVQWSYVLKP